MLRQTVLASQAAPAPATHRWLRLLGQASAANLPAEVGEAEEVTPRKQAVAPLGAATPETQCRHRAVGALEVVEWVEAATVVQLPTGMRGHQRAAVAPLSASV